MSQKIYYGLIYKVTNLMNRKVYIGQTIQGLEKRKKEHLKNYKKHNKIYLYKAFKKYRIYNFKWEIVGYCNSKEELNESEIICIEFYQSNNKIYGYNLTKGGGGMLGYMFTKEHLKHLSESVKGKKKPPFTEEHCKNISNSRKGIKKTEECTVRTRETCLKNNSYNKGWETRRKRDKELNRVNPRIGRKCTPEHVENNRQSHLNKKLKLESIIKRKITRKKNRELKISLGLPVEGKGRVPWNKGKTMTEEQLSIFRKNRELKKLYLTQIAQLILLIHKEI
jgi:group I intron endonuclease